MILSMTGFGKALAELSDKKVSVEIKSLNSKQLDLNTRFPVIYREKEMEIRAFLLQAIERGKVDFSIFIEYISNNSSTRINRPIIEGYMSQIREIAESLQIEAPTNWFSVLLKLPETIKSEIIELNEEEWQVVYMAIKKAIGEFQSFRQQEGSMLEHLFQDKIHRIAALIPEIEKYEQERIDKVKTKMQEALLKIDNPAYDANRFEQELIFYIEKLDISEEKNRLINHLHYFKETMQTEKSQGRKLGFIAQEIGREINTLGSKSNHAEMQKIVVQMKDELEQIKEQLLNVL